MTTAEKEDRESEIWEEDDMNVLRLMVPKSEGIDRRWILANSAAKCSTFGNLLTVITTYYRWVGFETFCVTSVTVPAEAEF